MWFSIQIHTTCRYLAGAAPARPQGTSAVGGLVVGAAGPVVGCGVVAGVGTALVDAAAGGRRAVVAGPAPPVHDAINPAASNHGTERADARCVRPWPTWSCLPGGAAAAGSGRAVSGVHRVGKVSPRAALAAVVLAVTVASCSKVGGSAGPADQQFVAGVHASAVDIGEFRSDGQLIKLGHVTCDAFRAHANLQQIASLLEGGSARSLPAGDVGAVMASAVTVLCPAYAGRINPVPTGG